MDEMVIAFLQFAPGNANPLSSFGPMIYKKEESCPPNSPLLWMSRSLIYKFSM